MSTEPDSQFNRAVLATIDALDTKVTELMMETKKRERLKLILPQFITLVGIIALGFSNYSAYFIDKDSKTTEELKAAIELVKQSKELPPAFLRLVLEKKEGIPAFITIGLTYVLEGSDEAVVYGLTGDVATNPGERTEILSAANAIDPEIKDAVEKVETQTPTPSIPTAQMDEEFEKTLDKLQSGATLANRIEAVYAITRWQEADGFIDRLLSACEGTLQAWTPQGINVRVINTMQVLLQIKENLLIEQKDTIQSWIKSNIMKPEVGPQTKRQAQRVLDRINTTLEKPNEPAS